MNSYDDGLLFQQYLIETDRYDKDLDKFISALELPNSVSVEAVSILLETTDEISSDLITLEESKIEAIKKSIIAFIDNIIKWIKKIFKSIKDRFKPKIDDIDEKEFEKSVKSANESKSLKRLREIIADVKNRDNKIQQEADRLREGFRHLRSLGEYLDELDRFSLETMFPRPSDIFNESTPTPVGFTDKSIIVSYPNKNFSNIYTPIPDDVEHDFKNLKIVLSGVKYFDEQIYLDAIKDLKEEVKSIKDKDVESKKKLKRLKNQISSINIVLKTYASLSVNILKIKEAIK